MSLAEQWSSGVVGYLLVDGLALRIRRVNSEQLSRVGYDHLEGSEAYAVVAQEQAREQQERLLRGVLAQQGADPAQTLAELATKERTDGIRRLIALTETPEKEAALLERCDAYLCAAVDGAAEVAHHGPPVVVTTLTDAPGAWHPFRFVRIASGPDDAEVGRLGRHTRTLAGLALISLLQGVTRRRVESFPASPGPAGRAPRAREDVPHDTGGGDALDS